MASSNGVPLAQTGCEIDASLEQHREIPVMRTVRVRNANAEQELKVASSS